MKNKFSVLLAKEKQVPHFNLQHPFPWCRTKIGQVILATDKQVLGENLDAESELHCSSFGLLFFLVSYFPSNSLSLYNNFFSPPFPRLK